MTLRLGHLPRSGDLSIFLFRIIGYNTAKNEIIFSDSWGDGHEMKRMAAPDASAATMGLYLLQPST